MSSSGLGRGLESLLTSNPAATPIDSERITYLAVDLIEFNPRQPRENFSAESLQELANSIKKCGILQPLIVAKTAVGYELIAGERRLKAAKLAGLKQVPVIIRSADEEEKLILALIENIQRENLNPLEEARAYRQLLDEFHLTQDELAKSLGKGRSTISNILRLLNLPSKVKEALRAGQISVGQAKVLAGLEPSKQIEAFSRMASKNKHITVAETTKSVRHLQGLASSSDNIPKNNDRGREFLLQEFLQAKVKIVREEHGGEIRIKFNNDDDLLRLMDRIRHS
ncbi:ParB/RepB/Spo0J family partition protein [Patescibacteria group bacterium]|jgi:ParB family chromosome partitioning protein|nr:ParB/RepB/Spo0J family partition protein [Patescibacteria group bacterium]